MQSKVIITIKPKTKNIWDLYLEGKTKPISAHRFVSLMGWETYKTRNDLILDFYGLDIVPVNIRMEMGTILEPTLLAHEYGEDVYVHENLNSTNKGNAITEDDADDVNGLPDAIVYTRDSIGECKVTTSPIEGCKKSWYKQVQFYAYYWNKSKYPVTNFKVNKVEILKYYVDPSALSWQVQHPNEIVLENYNIYTFPLDNEIEQDILIAKKRKEEIIKEPVKVKSSYNRLLWKIAMGVKNKKVKFKYDKEDTRALNFIKIINDIIRKEKENETNN